MLVFRCSTYLIFDCFYLRLYCIKYTKKFLHIAYVNIAQHRLILHFDLNICIFTDMICAILLFILCHLCFLYNDSNLLLQFLYISYICSLIHSHIQALMKYFMQNSYCICVIMFHIHAYSRS